MIREYAIEPSVLLSWSANRRDYAEFLREYGLGTPRIISSFPKKQVRKLRSYFLSHAPSDNESQQGMRYLEMVNSLVECIVLRDVVPPDGVDWSQHVTAENERIPFDVIISSEPIRTDRNITPDTMYDSGSIWNHNDQISIPRTDEGIKQATSKLIKFATSKIVVIDAYGWRDKAIRQMQRLINLLNEGRLTSSPPSIYLYYKTSDSGLNATEVRQSILARISTEETFLDFKVWELDEVPGSDVFHNRCILTEHGGVIFGHGIGVSGSETHTDEAILMRPEVYMKKWDQFVENNCFHVISNA